MGDQATTQTVSAALNEVQVFVSELDNAAYEKGRHGKPFDLLLDLNLDTPEDAIKQMAQDGAKKLANDGMPEDSATFRLFRKVLEMCAEAYRTGLMEHEEIAI